MSTLIYRDFPIKKDDVEESDYESALFDSNNNILHIKYTDSFESWYEYDENENLVKYKECCGYKEKSEYDDYRNLVSYSNSEGVSFESEYDDNGNPIHFKDLTTGYEEWYEYNDYGDIVYFKNSERYEEIYQYDAPGVVSYYKNNNGVEEKVRFYNKTTNVYRRDYRSDFSQVFVYDNDNGYTTRYLDKPSYMIMRMNDYDKLGNVKHDLWNRNFKSYYRWYYYHYDYLSYGWGDRRYGFNQSY